MFVRFFAVFIFCLALSAHAGDGPAPCQGQDQGQGQDCPPAPIPVSPAPCFDQGQGQGQDCPAPAPQSGFCDGSYDGFLAAQPGPLSLQIQSAGQHGEIGVTANWNGNTWVGRGLCQPVSATQASIVFQFPNTPVQRGMITVGGDGQAELDGQVDGGDSFRLMRR